MTWNRTKLFCFFKLISTLRLNNNLTFDPFMLFAEPGERGMSSGGGGGGGGKRGGGGGGVAG